MIPTDGEQTPRSGVGRREQDRRLQKQLSRYQKAFNVGRVITSVLNRETLFEVIIHQVNEAMESERSTVFVYDEPTEDLWSLVAVGLRSKEIRIPSDYGVAGWVFKHRTPVLVNNAYEDPRFYPDVDKKTGFKTRNILCIPLIDWRGNCVGSLQSLNKIAGDFTRDDEELLFSISHYVTVALENMTLYEELVNLNKAKERMINHLAHELRTPLAILKGVLERFEREFPEVRRDKLPGRLARARRNLARLNDIAEKVEDVFHYRKVEDKKLIWGLVEELEDALRLVVDAGQEAPERYRESIEWIREIVRSVYHVEKISLEPISLSSFLGEICRDAALNLGDRDLVIVQNLEKDLTLNMDKEVLRKVVGGILKNAIENTPDEGTIEVKLQENENGLEIRVTDTGVGISEQNQKLILGGFFHTQETLQYSSKHPYSFNAGGAALDLMRAKAFSERFGFTLDFESKRCGFVPEDTDVCPGRISACPNIKTPGDCLGYGGTSFRVLFPTG